MVLFIICRGGEEFLPTCVHSDVSRCIQVKIGNYKSQEAQEVEKLKRQQDKDIEQMTEKHKKLDEDVERKVENALKAQATRSERMDISYKIGQEFSP